MPKGLLAFLFCLAASAASAEPSDFCAERPGQTTPPCVMDPGRVMLETSATTWTLDNHGPARTDAFLVGDSQLRIGLGHDLEFQGGWTPVGVVRIKDKAGGGVTTTSGVGDVRLGLLYGLAGQNGPVAVQGFVSLPTGGDAIGAGDWGAGLRLPVALNGPAGFQIGLTPEVDAEVNGAGSGHHLAYGGALGLGHALSRTLQVSADVAVFRHDDPAGRTINVTAGASLAWQARSNTQFDLGMLIGLDRDSPNAQLSVGVAHRF